MNQVTRPHYKALFCLTLAAAIFTFGCSKKPVASTPPPAPYTPPPATPTVTLQANPTSINQGDTSTLNWSSTNATQLTITPDVGQVTAEGSTKVTPTSSVTYSITATGPGGSANASARITVATPPPPDNGTSSDLTDALFLKEVRDAYFDLDKADIRPDAREALSHTSEFLRNYPQLKVTIEGHCDERGSTEYNLGLGDRRAAAVKQYLISQGISADRLSTVSFGKEKPFCTESNEECWQQNRRGHFVKAN
ncbi:MAG: peptidoglycan-associated lipoprotein Pal [Candidatus Acidiferrum sp.]|jgi:peptidoglycan-associated lipoprotein